MSPSDENLSAISPMLIERFHSNISKVPDENGCLHWTASCGDKGYALFRIGKTKSPAHRVALFLHTGTLGIVAMHKCDVPSCCNPEHLVWGSSKDNTQDCINKGRRKQCHGMTHGRRKIDQSVLVKIFDLRNQGLSLSQIAAHVDVQFPQVSRILSGHRWAKETEELRASLA